MAFQPSADSFGIRHLGFKCSWWHRRQANDAVASERSIFSENHNYKVFPCRGEHVRTYISGSRCTWWQKTTNRQTYIHTHTQDNYSNPRCAHARRGLIMVIHHLFVLIMCTYTPFTLHSQNCSSLPRTVPSGSVNGSFLSRTVPFWKGRAIDSRTVLELFRVSVNGIIPGTVPEHA